MPELAISTEKVCILIDRLRATAGREPSTATTEGVTGDQGEFAEIEEQPDDATMAEVAEVIAGMTREERINLTALFWLGRGDFDIEEWADALAEAAGELSEGAADFPLTEELTPEFLAAGLEALGHSCDAFE